MLNMCNICVTYVYTYVTEMLQMFIYNVLYVTKIFTEFYRNSELKEYFIFLTVFCIFAHIH